MIEKTYRPANPLVITSVTWLHH